MNKEQLIQDLIVDEDLRTALYRCTAGKTTIGIGRNLTDNGIRKNEAMFMALNDIEDVESELNSHAPWWREMPEQAQRALANMCFNLGWPRLSKFQNMLNDLENRRYDSAAEEALDSRWAEQVGERAHRIADLIRNA